MGKLKDLSQIIKPGHDLPINGKTYHVPAVTAEVGLAFNSFVSVAFRAQQAKQKDQDFIPDDDDMQILNDQQEHDMVRDVLTDGLWEEMVEDGLTFEHMRIASMYALIHATQGEEVADRFWTSGGKAQAPNRSARRTATRTRTAAASTTRKRA